MHKRKNLFESSWLSYVFYFLTFSPILLHFLLSSYVFVLRNLSNMEVWMCLTSTQIFLNFWTFKCQRMNYETRLTNMTITQMKGFCDFLLRIYMNHIHLPTHIVWKSPKTSHLNIGIFNIFCPIKIDLSDNTVWPQASGFQKLPKIGHF